MTIKIENIKVTDPQSPFHGKTVNVYIANGEVKDLGEGLLLDYEKLIDGKGLNISPGFFDLRVSTGEPGQEYRETLESAAEAALRGGVTGFLLMPDTQPAIDNSSMLNHIHGKALAIPIDVKVAGAVSKKLEGKELSEMFDMAHAGVAAFSDFNHTISNSKLLELSLKYSQPLGLKVFHQPNDTKLAWGGVANENVAATQSGLRGVPEVAEEIGVLRDLLVARHVETEQLVLSPVTLSSSLNHISEAKNKGIHVGVCTSIAHLFFNDEKVKDFDANFKIFPPLRKESDRVRLVEACLAGEIDAVYSDHIPWDEDAKLCEFEIAKPGMSGLETLFPALNTVLGVDNLQTTIALLSINSRRMLGLNVPKIEVGQEADFVIYDPLEKRQITQNSLKSKGKNNPFVGITLQGVVKAVIKGTTTVEFDNA